MALARARRCHELDQCEWRRRYRLVASRRSGFADASSSRRRVARMSDGDARLLAGRQRHQTSGRAATSINRRDGSTARSSTATADLVFSIGPFHVDVRCRGRSVAHVAADSRTLVGARDSRGLFTHLSRASLSTRRRRWRAARHRGRVLGVGRTTSSHLLEHAPSPDADWAGGQAVIGSRALKHRKRRRSRAA
jgi:hypothetical protein